MILTKQHQDVMDTARAELLGKFNEADLDMSKLLIINGAHTAGFIAGLEHQQAANAALVEALRPFAALWLEVFCRMSDDVPIAGVGDTVITVGDVKIARAAVAGVSADPREGPGAGEAR